MKTLNKNNLEICVYFNNRCLANIENELKKPIVKIASEFSQDNISVNVLAVMLKNGINSFNTANNLSKKISLSDAFDLMDQLGFVTVATFVGESIAEALTFDPEKKTD